MNWEAIGAVGEIAGAIGVIITLIYLALQIRQNTRASRIASFQASTEMLNSVSQSIATNSELAEILDVLSSGSRELTPSEFQRFSFLTLSLFRSWETAFYQRTEGMALQQSWERYEGSIRNQLSMPQVREWWRTGSFGFTTDFKNHIDLVIGDLSNDV